MLLHVTTDTKEVSVLFSASFLHYWLVCFSVTEFTIIYEDYNFTGSCKENRRMWARNGKVKTIPKDPLGRNITRRSTAGSEDSLSRGEFYCLLSHVCYFSWLTLITMMQSTEKYQCASPPHHVWSSSQLNDTVWLCICKLTYTKRYYN